MQGVTMKKTMKTMKIMNGELRRNWEEAAVTCIRLEKLTKSSGCTADVRARIRSNRHQNKVRSKRICSETPSWNFYCLYASFVREVFLATWNTECNPPAIISLEAKQTDKTVCCRVQEQQKHVAYWRAPDYQTMAIRITHHHIHLPRCRTFYPPFPLIPSQESHNIIT